jgi:hypothetical protein
MLVQVPVRQCAGCDMPIVGEDLGGWAISAQGTDLYFHNNAACYRAAAKQAASHHSVELKHEADIIEGKAIRKVEDRRYALKRQDADNDELYF